MTFWQQVFFSVDILSLTALMMRGIIMYTLIVLVTRVMGQREVGNMTTFDAVVTITVGNIAAAPMFNNEDSVIRPAIAIVTLGVLHVMTSAAGTRWPHWRRLVGGQPVVLIKDGKVLEENLRAARLTLDDLMQELRLKEAPRLSDVEVAVMEPRGRISVIKRPQVQPATRGDLGLPAQRTGLPAILVVDGKIQHKNLKQAGLTEGWLRARLRRSGITDLKQVAVAQVDAGGALYVDRTDDALAPPVSRAKPALAARLKKTAAQLERFALDTADPEARQQYREAARRVREALERLAPLLRASDRFAGVLPTPEPESDEAKRRLERWAPGRNKPGEG